MFAFFDTFSRMEIIDLVIATPVILFLIALAMAIGICLWRGDKKFMGLVREYAFREAERGTRVEKVMQLCLFYIVFTALLAYIGSVYFAMSLGVIAVLFSCFAFYYLAVVEEYKNGARYE